MAIATSRRRLRMIVADLDGTLLHDAPTFEDRFLTDRCVHAIERVHDQGVKFVISTARPVSTGLPLVHRLPVDACIYLNGALIDLRPNRSDISSLINPTASSDDNLVHIGFTSRRGCDLCRRLLSALPGLRIGLVMHDMRYANFDVSAVWKTQPYRLTDFTDIPEGDADKIIIFPNRKDEHRLVSLIPDDFAVSVSEGTMWMLANPAANKGTSLRTVCHRMQVPLAQTTAFGDDTIDIGMLNNSGHGVAVANAHPRLLHIADEVCASNNDDGVAQWIERFLDEPSI